MKRLTALVLVLALLCPVVMAEQTVQMANPWRETTAGELIEALGVRFGVPEDSENVTYRVLESESLAEMRFGWHGAEYTARIRPTAEFEDISGFYYSWDAEEDCEIGWCEGKIMSVAADEELVRLCLWYDAAPGLMYSIGALAPADAQIDILAAAQSVYLPVQGEVD